jgi:hypothetical protein
MFHVIHRVEQFTIVAPYTLNVRFNDGTTQRIDFRPVLEGQLFGPLKDVAVFNAVALDPEAGTLAWPNGADFDPTMLHDWPEAVSGLAAMARGWAERERVGRAQAAHERL